jgi:rubrerythrin
MSVNIQRNRKPITIQHHLARAFAAESEANHQYLAFAEQAEEEGHSQIGRLFRAVAAAEAVHARNHVRTLGAVKGTRENLDRALARETHEFDVMYPAMIIQAVADGEEEPRCTFHWANEAEKTHLNLYQKALENWDVDRGDFPYFVCPCCGHTQEREAPAECPVCDSDGDEFMKVY